MRNIGLSSGRNYFTELERLYDFKFTRVSDENPDGIGTHLRYGFSSPEIAAAILKEINASRARRDAGALTKEQEAELLVPFKRLL